jgi:hypothetical protein
LLLGLSVFIAGESTFGCCIIFELAALSAILMLSALFIESSVVVFSSPLLLQATKDAMAIIAKNFFILLGFSLNFIRGFLSELVAKLILAPKNPKKDDVFFQTVIFF